LTPSQQSFLKLANHPFKFRIYLLYRLPAAFFSGIKIRGIGEERCITSVPYKWLTQNPFRSTYFASLAMAAEMSTGTLALSNAYKRIPAISMLVTKMEAAYFKKVTGITFFTCEDGKVIKASIEEAASTGEAQKIIAKSTGTDKNGELVAEFLFTWSFKAKSGRLS
jgi:hypothetical protein